MGGFSAASAVVVGTDGSFVAHSRPHWFQGPGIYGGLSGGMLLRAMAEHAGDKAVRTATLQFCAPVPEGALRLSVDLERANLATAFLSGKLVHADAPDKVLVHGMAAFGRNRSTDLDFDRLERPAVAPPDGIADIPTDMVGIPVFLENFDMRFAAGYPPYSGADTTGFVVHLRPRHPEPVDAALALGLLDAVPPAVLARSDRVRRMASLSLHVQFLRPLPDPSLDEAGFWLVQASSLVARDGFSDQTVSLFAPDGVVAAVVRQLFVLV